MVLLTGCRDSENRADTGEASSADETGAEVTSLAEEDGFYRISWQPEDDTAEGYVRKGYLDVD